MAPSGHARMVIGLVALASNLGLAIEPVQIDALAPKHAPKHRLTAKHQRKPQDVPQRDPPRQGGANADSGEPMLAHNVHRPERFDPLKHPRVTALDSDAEAEGDADAGTPKLAYNVHRPERYDPKSHPRQHPELAHELTSRPRPQQEPAQITADAPPVPIWEPTQGRAQ